MAGCCSTKNGLRKKREVGWTELVIQGNRREKKVGQVVCFKEHSGSWCVVMMVEIRYTYIILI